MGEWTHVVREVAGYDYDRALQVASWPLCDVLEAMLHIQRGYARDAYNLSLLLCYIRPPKDGKPPRVPRILKDD